MKSTRQKADTELVRRQNRSLVLESLRRSGPLASIELGEVTNLSPATISAITNDMLNERLIEADREETDKHRQTQRGRPKVKLKLCADAALVLGIEVTHNALRFLCADYMGVVHIRATVSTESARLSAVAFTKLLIDNVKAFLRTHDISPKRVSVACITCQGSVDARTGELIWSPAFHAKNIQIAAPLTEEFNFRVIVANDTNAIAHALNTERSDKRGSFAALYLSSGIGLGLFVNGRLLEGSHGSASEFGHMLWKADGALCRCGRRGCIEAYASDFGIYRSANPELADTHPSEITPTAKDMADLVKRAETGDVLARQAFEIAGQALGAGLTNLIMLVNPQEVLLTGPGRSYFHLMEPGMRSVLNHVSDRGVTDKIDILADERNLAEIGLLSMAYTCLDTDVFASRVSVADMAARHKPAEMV